MNTKSTYEVKLFGAGQCHKTVYYSSFFEKLNIDFQFLDVVMHEKYAEALKDLYDNRRLNFPTITIGDKRLRNPSDKELMKWLVKLKLL